VGDFEQPQTDDASETALQCQGCGITLQSDHEDKVGYIPRHVYDQTLKLQRLEDVDAKERRLMRDQAEALKSEINFLRNKIKTKRVAKDSGKKDQVGSLERTLEKRLYTLHNLEKMLEHSVSVPITEMSNAAEFRHSVGTIRRTRRKRLTCMRCHKLTNYGLAKGSVDVMEDWRFSALLSLRLNPPADKAERDSLRIGLQDAGLLEATEGGEDVEDIRPAVVVKLVDVFDVQGTLLKGLQEIVAQKHRLLIVANKADLLPESVGLTRVTSWLRSQVQKAGLDPHSVHILSAKKPHTVEFKRFLQKVRQAAQPDPIQAGRYLRASKDGALDVYIIGATNVGKSTLVNALIDQRIITTGRKVTTSGLPGTTLGLVEFKLKGEGKFKPGRLFDTPGVVDRSHPMHSLQKNELQAIMPRTRLRPVTYKLKAGQSLLLGALVLIEQTAGRPFFFTAVVSPQVTVHVTRSEKVAELLATRTGGDDPFLYPPYEHKRVLEVGVGAVPAWNETIESIRELKELSDCNSPKNDDSNAGAKYSIRDNPTDSNHCINLLEFQGKGWRKACVEIVLPGLGWVGLSGVGMVRVAVHSPPSIEPIIREPLLPFDALPTSKRFHGDPRKRT